MRSHRHPALLQCTLALMTLLIAIASICLGQYPLSPAEVFRQLAHLSPLDGVAGQVAVSGSIAWVGLVIPHLSRLLVGADHRRLLPTAFWLGGGFMIVVEDLARTLTQAEIPIGIITALVGAPLFTWLLAQSRRTGAR